MKRGKITLFVMDRGNENAFFEVMASSDLWTVIRKFTYPGKRTRPMDTYLDGVAAAKYNYIHLFKHRYPLILNPHVETQAIQHDNVDILRYYWLSNPVGKNVLERACCSNARKVIVYILKNKPFLITPRMYTNILVHHRQIAEFLLQENLFPMIYITTRYAINYGILDKIPDKLYDKREFHNMFTRAMDFGQVKILSYFVGKGYVPLVNHQSVGWKNVPDASVKFIMDYENPLCNDTNKKKSIMRKMISYGRLALAKPYLEAGIVPKKCKINDFHDSMTYDLLCWYLEDESRTISYNLVIIGFKITDERIISHIISVFMKTDGNKRSEFIELLHRFVCNGNLDAVKCLVSMHPEYATGIKPSDIDIGYWNNFASLYNICECILWLARNNVFASPGRVCVVNHSKLHASLANLKYASHMPHDSCPSDKEYINTHLCFFLCDVNVIADLHYLISYSYQDLIFTPHINMFPRGLVSAIGHMCYLKGYVEEYLELVYKMKINMKEHGHVYHELPHHGRPEFVFNYYPLIERFLRERCIDMSPEDFLEIKPEYRNDK